MFSCYDWVRFLVPRGGSVSVDSLGLLRDPEEEWGALENRALVKLAHLQDTPVLVILGEPGMGKTTLLLEATEVARTAGRAVKDVDLAGFESEERLLRDLTAEEIIDSQEDLDLFIDSFDTGLLEIPTLSKIVAEAIPPNRDGECQSSCRIGRGLIRVLRGGQSIVFRSLRFPTSSSASTCC